MKNLITGRKAITLFVVLAFFGLMLTACGGASEEEVRTIVAEEIAAAMSTEEEPADTTETKADETEEEPADTTETEADETEEEPADTAGETDAEETDEETTEPDVVLLDGLVTLTGFPEEAETVRWGFDLGRDENDCGFPPLAWLICNPGVLSFDIFNGSDENNPSAVWSGGANVDVELTTLVSQVLLPGNGYMKTNWAGGTIRFDDYTVTNQPTDGVSYMFVARGTYAEEGGGQTPVNFEFSDEEYVGAGKAMRYPIEDPAASGFYSWTHFDDDVQHQLSGDNCVYSGCGLVVIIATDKNRGNVTVATYDPENGYVEVYTNSRNE